MSKLPYMKVFVPDLISDTFTLSDGEFGAYTRIMYALWRHKGTLPLDYDELRKIAGSTGKTWPAKWAKISRYFSFEGGVLSHARVTEDLLSASSPGDSIPPRGFPGESLLPRKPLKNLNRGSARVGARDSPLELGRIGAPHRAPIPSEGDQSEARPEGASALRLLEGGLGEQEAWEAALQRAELDLPHFTAERDEIASEIAEFIETATARIAAKQEDVA